MNGKNQKLNSDSPLFLEEEVSGLKLLLATYEIVIISAILFYFFNPFYNYKIISIDLNQLKILFFSSVGLIVLVSLLAKFRSVVPLLKYLAVAGISSTISLTAYWTGSIWIFLGYFLLLVVSSVFFEYKICLLAGFISLFSLGLGFYFIDLFCPSKILIFSIFLFLFTIFMAFFSAREKKAIKNLMTKEGKRLKETTDILLKKEEELTKTFEKMKIEKERAEKARIITLSILEEVKMTRNLAEAERNRTQSIIENLIDGLLVFDKKYRVSSINPQAENFLGKKSKEVVGKSIWDIKASPYLKPLIELLGGEEIKKIFRKELPIRPGLILEITTAPLLEREKKVGTLVILHDITREKLVERMKTDFVSLAAHQLRTPLSAIKWSLDMILGGDLGKITKEQREFLEKSYQSNERMITLINDLLNITRIEEGKYLYKLNEESIEDLAEETLKSFQPLIKEKKIKVNFRKPEVNLPKLKVDKEKIQLVFQNLLDNAIRYSPPKSRVTISLEYDKNNIKVVVRDTGVGIPKNQQDKIFTRFFRGKNIMKIDTEGTGLGLYITKNIIEAHGGKIWFESEEGRGTTFYFTLPVK